MGETKRNYLLDNTTFFGTTFADVIRDMLGLNYRLSSKVTMADRFIHESGMLVYIHFSGIIQGEYTISLTEETAARMIGAWTGDAGIDALRRERENYAEFFKEALNTTVGTAIQLLEKDFNGLSFLPAVVVYGELDYPQVPVGRISVAGTEGNVDCGFILNMANLGVGEKLQQALADIRVKNNELREAQQNMQRILDVFPAGLVAVDKTGKVLPGYSKKTAETIGLEPDAQVAGRDLIDLVGIDAAKAPATATDFRNWIELVYLKYDELDYKLISDLSPLTELTNIRERIVHLKSVPIPGVDPKTVDRILFVIEDVTMQRCMEDEMKRIRKQHDMNLELLSQVINLEPDEVTQFVYDSTELLARAEKILQSDNRDREFINTLYRTIHTLKGASGQFRFKQLQEMARSIESRLSPFRENGVMDDRDVKAISMAISEVNGYIDRLDDLRQKLGGENETIKRKAMRSTPSMMVALENIDTVVHRAANLLSMVRKLDEDEYIVQAVATLKRDAQRLRQLNLKFFEPSLAALAQRTAERLKKKVVFQIQSDIRLDIEVMRRLHEVFMHLVANAVGHGIECPDERRAADKLETGLIIVDALTGSGKCIITVSDDGGGVNLDRVKEKLVERHGRLQSQVEAMTNQELIETIFLPAFSTADEVTEISGRGVGMDVVASILKELDGTVTVRSEKGKGTEFAIHIPLSTSCPDVTDR